MIVVIKNFSIININEMQKNVYENIKYSRDSKERKQKGDVVDSWYKVSLTKVYDDEKEPIGAPIYEDSGYESF